MKKISVCMLGLCFYLGMSAQMINDGATMIIESNASLKIEGNLSNINAGMLTVLGVLEVEGNLTNLATLNTEANSTVRFSGTSASAFTSGNAMIYHLEINKSGSATVNLADDLTVTNELEFTSGKVMLGDHNLNLGASTAVTNPGSDAYIATNGTGRVLKSLTGNGTVFMPIGDEDDYSPLTMDIEGTVYVSAQIITKVVSSTHSEKPEDAESYIKRYWEVESSGITGYSNEWSGDYVASDVEGNTALIKGASYNGFQWDYFNSGGSMNNVSGSTVESMADLTGTNFYGRADIRVFLQGAYDSSTGLMTTALNSLGLIPLSSPYTDAPVTVSSIPTDVTDWIKLEMRSIADPSHVLGRVSAFLKNDGTIISATGGSLPQVKDSDGSSIVSVHHRNHLPVRSGTGLNTMNPVLHDFSIGMSQAFINPSITTNSPMILLEPNIYGLFRGNTNGNTTLNILDLILTKNGTNPSQSNVYSNADTNMNGTTNILDLTLTKVTTIPSKTAHF